MAVGCYVGFLFKAFVDRSLLESRWPLEMALSLCRPHLGDSEQYLTAFDSLSLQLSDLISRGPVFPVCFATVGLEQVWLKYQGLVVKQTCLLSIGCIKRPQI